ncbi:hypothetical protein, partial [Streptomyces sp. GbtcB7]|uniref:hypothetical protein n=1 Tax=Streptomyces sp. GbtcB7 TaxID=2824752 RepID=UPI001C305510
APARPAATARAVSGPPRSGDQATDLSLFVVQVERWELVEVHKARVADIPGGVEEDLVTSGSWSDLVPADTRPVW